MTDKVIISDIDSTLLNFNIPWENFVESKGVEIPHRGFLQGHCRLTDALGVDEELEMELLGEFFSSQEFYDLPALTGAPEALQLLHSDGWTFSAITACPDGDLVSERRKNNLERVLGVPFTDVHITGVGGCKRNALSRYHPTVWVEDHFQNAVVGHEMGFRTFLMNQKHNRGHSAPMTRVDNWAEIVRHLWQS